MQIFPAPWKLSRDLKLIGMRGYERSLLYRFAAETGLRANEIRNLNVGDFDFGNLTVTVKAAYSKHRREDVLPLKPNTAGLLQDFFKGKMPTAKAFGGRYVRLTDKTSKMIEADLTDAGIPYVDDAGRYADFHSLRHTTGSLLAASGVHPKVAQSIMRHSDINLTLSRYTHTLIGQEAEAVAGLPDFSFSGREKQRATGTDNRPIDLGDSGSKVIGEKLTPKSTLKSTLPAFPACPTLADVGKAAGDGPKTDTAHKRLPDRTLGKEKDTMSPCVPNGAGGFRSLFVKSL